MIIPLRKVIKNKNATKSPRHEDTQRIDNQRIALCETLSLCVFSDKSEQVVAIKSLFGVNSMNIRITCSDLFRFVGNLSRFIGI